MTILCLTPRLPFPPIGGDKLRIYNLLKELSEYHDVHLISFIQSDLELKFLKEQSLYLKKISTVLLPKWSSYVKSIGGLFSSHPFQVHYYKSEKMRRLIINQNEKEGFDAIFVHLIRMAEYVKDLNGLIKIIDLTDAISLNYERSKKYRKDKFKWILSLENDRVRQYEIEILSKFNHAFLVSPIDRDYLSRFTNTKNVHIIPNGVNTDYFTFYNDKYDPNTIVFLGNMRTFPNTDAVEYFAHAILPCIIKWKPNTHFHIVGTEPNSRVRALAKLYSQITITDYVQDVRPYLRAAAVTVCPMRAGAGIQNKILESMAIGTPVTSTSIGIEGIDAVANRDVLIADEPESFANKVLELMTDKTLRKVISQNGRALIETKYTWQARLKQVKEIFNNNGLKGIRQGRKGVNVNNSSFGIVSSEHIIN